MGRLVQGQWRDDWYDTGSTGGRFEREPTRFRNAVTEDGASGFPAEAGRYHLYVSLACPWAHRTLIARKLKGLERVVDVSVVHPLMGSDGWTFDDTFPGATGDRVAGRRFLRDVYLDADARYTGRVTVPVLWDRTKNTIVNNESSEILRLFNGPLGSLGTRPHVDLYPEPLREGIDEVNAHVYQAVNNGVYRAGFATGQEAYEEAVTELFASLDRLEARLERSRFLLGHRITEADVRLFTTLVRFDPVYHGHFKCNLRRLSDYAALWAYTRDIYQFPGVAETVDLDHIRHHYYRSHRTINPTGVVPLGPRIDLDAPHHRQRLAA